MISTTVVQWVLFLTKAEYHGPSDHTSQAAEELHFENHGTRLKKKKKEYDKSSLKELKVLNVSRMYNLIILLSVCLAIKKA